MTDEQKSEIFQQFGRMEVTAYDMYIAIEESRAELLREVERLREIILEATSEEKS